MKRYSIFTALIISGFFALSAQDRGKNFEQMLEKYQAERVSFLTKALDMTVGQAEKFWPIYNEYLKKRDDIIKERRRGFQRPKDSHTISEAETDEMIQGRLDEEVKLVLLKKEYFMKIRGVLPAEKVMRLLRAEQEFMDHMLTKMREAPGREFRNRRL